MKKIIIILIAAAGFNIQANAQKPAVMISNSPGWHKIGETTVDFTKQRSEIAVMGANRFTSIKFKITQKLNA